MWKRRKRKMIGKIVIAVICLVYFGGEFGTASLTADERDGASYRAQASDGTAGTSQRPPQAASPPTGGRTRSEPAKEEKPAEAPKREPLKPFEPTEKIKADQALDFPADI
jgi:hypothetical protein